MIHTPLLLLSFPATRICLACLNLVHSIVIACSRRAGRNSVQCVSFSQQRARCYFIPLLNSTRQQATALSAGLWHQKLRSFVIVVANERPAQPRPTARPTTPAPRAVLIAERTFLTARAQPVQPALLHRPELCLSYHRQVSARTETTCHQQPRTPHHSRRLASLHSCPRPLRCM